MAEVVGIAAGIGSILKTLTSTGIYLQGIGSASREAQEVANQVQATVGTLPSSTVLKWSEATILPDDSVSQAGISAPLKANPTQSDKVPLWSRLTQSRKRTASTSDERVSGHELSEHPDEAEIEEKITGCKWYLNGIIARDAAGHENHSRQPIGLRLAGAFIYIDLNKRWGGWYLNPQDLDDNSVVASEDRYVYIRKAFRVPVLGEVGVEGDSVHISFDSAHYSRAFIRALEVLAERISEKIEKGEEKKPIPTHLAPESLSEKYDVTALRAAPIAGGASESLGTGALRFALSYDRTRMWLVFQPAKGKAYESRWICQTKLVYTNDCDQYLVDIERATILRADDIRNATDTVVRIENAKPHGARPGMEENLRCKLKVRGEAYLRGLGETWLHYTGLRNKALAYREQQRILRERADRWQDSE